LWRESSLQLRIDESRGSANLAPDEAGEDGLRSILWAGLMLAAAAPAAAETTLKPETTKAVEATADRFFSRIKAGAVDQAYTDLFGPEMARDKAQAIANLASQNATAIKLYGAIDGWDRISATETSPYLLKVKYELRLDRLPLFYEFTFYRKSDTAPWMVVKSYFSDNDAAVDQSGAGGQ
jgi:hypothetical protein